MKDEERSNELSEVHRVELISKCFSNDEQSVVNELKRFYCVSFDVFVRVQTKGKEERMKVMMENILFVSSREERKRERKEEEKREGEKKEKMFAANLNVVFIGT